MLQSRRNGFFLQKENRQVVEDPNYRDVPIRGFALCVAPSTVDTNDTKVSLCLYQMVEIPIPMW